MLCKMVIEVGPSWSTVYHPRHFTPKGDQSHPNVYLVQLIPGLLCSKSCPVRYSIMH